MTYQELIRALRDAGIEDAREEASRLFIHYGGHSRVSLVGANPDLSTPEFSAAVERRLSGEPLAYILGEVGFYNESYLVSPACLIPRADTEILVEEAVKRLPCGARFADFCTGSGCVAISTLAARTDTTAIAYDISEDALEVAAKNATRNGVNSRISFVKCDLLAEKRTEAWDAILSNPPYIPTDVIPTLSKEVHHEPRIALDGGADGLDFYRHIVSTYPCPLILFEIGYDQEAGISAIGAEHGYKVTIRRDYGGNVRCAVLEK
jgi:release factor glutamine methyltransferase